MRRRPYGPVAVALLEQHFADQMDRPVSMAEAEQLLGNPRLQGRPCSALRDDQRAILLCAWVLESEIQATMSRAERRRGARQKVKELSRQ